jgi:hypothetical protein
MRHRSWAFDAYLKGLQTIDPERYKQIVAAERKFIDEWMPRIKEGDRIFADQMEGWEDTPASAHNAE